MLANGCVELGATTDVRSGTLDASLGQECPWELLATDSRSFMSVEFMLQSLMTEVEAAAISVQVVSQGG